MKVVFLDFDGVMDTAYYDYTLIRDHKPNTDSYGPIFDPKCVNNLRLDAANGRWPEIKAPSLICYNTYDDLHIISISITGLGHSYIESLEVFTRWSETTENSRVYCRLNIESFHFDDIRAKIETMHWDKLNRIQQVMELNNIRVDHTKNDAYYIDTNFLEDNEAAFRFFLDLCIKVLMK